jgi:hypothetical protein
MFRGVLFLFVSNITKTVAKIDPLPHRFNNHNRTSKDARFLRTETKGEGNCGLLRGAYADPDALAPDRLPR